MVSYELTVDKTKYDALLKEMRREMPTVMHKILDRTANMIINKLKLKITQVFKSHSGYLRRTTERIFENNETVKILVGAIYSLIQEWGGDIYPKNVRNLAIPIGDLKGSPRQYNLRFTMRGMKKFLIDNNGKFQYLLTKHVYIPGKHYFHPTVQGYLRSEESKRLIVKTLQQEIDRLSKKVA